MKLGRSVLQASVALALLAGPASWAGENPDEARGEARGEAREVVVVVDTSNSMRTQDARRDTVQMVRILADLLGDRDGLTAVKMAKHESCSSQADPRLALRLDPRRRDVFTRDLDRHLAFNTGTNFATALRTAIALLDGASERRRLLLVLADAGGLGSCQATLTNELVALRQRGVQLAAVHLGRGDGAFAGNPAFESATAARDAGQLIAAVALVYQRFLGVKRVQSGRVEGRRIDAEVAPHVSRAFLVVAADGEVGPVRAEPGLDGRTAIDDGSGGATLGRDGQKRAYRIVRLERPVAGAWSFELPELADIAGWMLVQESALGVRLVPTRLVSAGLEPGTSWVAGQPATLTVEVYDQETGQRVTDPAALPGLTLEADLGGHPVPLEAVGEGRFTTRFEPASSGGTGTQTATLNVRLRSDLIDQSFTVKADVSAASPLEVPLEVPLEMEVVAEPWLVRWWPVLALVAFVVASAVAIHGFVTPARFSPRAGLQLAQEEALQEGFFHPFRGQRGAGSGFYRDARLFVHPDFRLASTSSGALAKLRATASGGVTLLPLTELWRRAADGEWERLDTEERRLRPGVVHRDSAGSLFFELRHG